MTMMTNMAMMTTITMMAMDHKSGQESEDDKKLIQKVLLVKTKSENEKKLSENEN